MTRRRLAAALALVVSGTSLLDAQTRVPTHDPDRVLIEHTGPVQLSNDFMVMRFHIVNRSGRDRTWTFEFYAQHVAYSTGGRRSRFELAVGNDEDREFELLVPLARAPDASWVQMIPYGYGVVNAGRMEVVANTVSSTAAISTQVALEQLPVRQTLLGNHGPGEPIQFQARSLTDDWRAYAGLSTLWLSATEWSQADPAVQRALRSWVAGGGRLVLVEPGDGVRSEPIVRHGMGAMVTIPAGLTDANVGNFIGVLPPEISNLNSVSWASAVVEPIETHKGLLSFILLGYLVVAGPVNLFVLSPRGKRMRLFWTMPTIALATSAMLAAVIVLQDGVGGSGVRASFVYLYPEANGVTRELLVQEQVSRTGALLRRSFEIEEPVHVTPLATFHRAHPFPDTASYVTEGSRYEGDWFRARSVQGQLLQATRASRAGIELVRAAAERRALLSSIDVRLEELYFRDRRGEIWHAENVLPGRPASMSPATEEEYGRFRASVQLRAAGPKIRSLTATIGDLPGTFLARAAEGASTATIETLSSIDWTESLVLYAGHVAEDEG